MIRAPEETARREALTKLLREAATHVPWYRQTFDSMGPAGTGACLQLENWPLLTRAEFCRLDFAQRLDARFRDRRLITMTSGGSTGTPITMHLDRHCWMRRQLRFLRALMSAGYRPGQKLMLVTDSTRSRVFRLGRWHYVSLGQDSAALADAFLRIRPDVLYGCTTPLLLMAERLQKRSTGTSVAAVLTTAETLQPGARRRLEVTFGAPVRDFYGSSELGLVAWQPAGDPTYRIAEDGLITEYLPVGSDRYRLVATSLDSRAMPLIRYDTGDLVSFGQRDAPSSIVRFEGREIDCLTDVHGQRVSPYRLTTRLDEIDELIRYKVVQTRPDRVDIQVQTRGDLTSELSAKLECAVAELLGGPVTVGLELRDRLIADGTRKFRPVENRIPAPSSHAWAGNAGLLPA
jgi:phenylacetate-CoA ligase